MATQLPPRPINSVQGGFEWGDWYDKVRFAINNANNLNFKAGAPTTADVRINQWAIYKNTSLGTVRLWANDNGTMKSVQLV